eukprot:193270-Pleurochrysis_carterae.AAC.2
MIARNPAASMSGVPTFASTVAATNRVTGCERTNAASANSLGTLELTLATSARSCVNPCAPRAIAPTKAKVAADGDAAINPSTKASTEAKMTIAEAGKFRARTSLRRAARSSTAELGTEERARDLLSNCDGVDRDALASPTTCC